MTEENKGGWFVPQFKKFDELAKLMEKIANNEIKVTEDKMLKLQKILEVKAHLEELRKQKK
jgi:hypothetical protein